MIKLIRRLFGLCPRHRWDTLEVVEAFAKVDGKITGMPVRLDYVQQCINCGEYRVFSVGSKEP